MSPIRLGADRGQVRERVVSLREDSIPPCRDVLQTVQRINLLRIATPVEAHRARQARLQAVCVRETVLLPCPLQLLLPPPFRSSFPCPSLLWV
jgi:hypothetical protein